MVATIKKWYFDRRKVMKKHNRAIQRNFTWYGRDTRQEARRKIKRKQPTKKQLARLRDDDERKRKRAAATIAKRLRMVSQPGQPPFSKDPQDRIRRISYQWQPSKRAVIVGYAKLSNVVAPHTPKSLEYGGASVAVARFDNTNRKRSGNARKKINIRPRPAIGPAGRVALAKLKARTKDSLK